MAGQEGTGARGGSRRGPRPKRRFRPELVGLGAGAVLAIAVWGLLVWLAIGFGRDARGGDSGQWLWLALTTLGAVVCLFGALWLVTLLLRGIGLLDQPTRTPRSGGGARRH